MQPVVHGRVDPQYTLGVVLPVLEPQRGVLRAWRERYGGPDGGAVDPHITLVTGSHRAGWPQAAAHVRQVAARHAAFDVVLGPAATFRPASPVVYLPLLAGGDQCRALHAELLQGPLRHDSPFEYHPHLTIAQNVEEPLLEAAQEHLAAASLRFHAAHVLLFDVAGGRWQLRERVPLSG